MISGGTGAWRCRGNRVVRPKPASQALTGSTFTMMFGRFHVPVHETPRVQFPERGGNRRGQSQENREVKWTVGGPVQELAWPDATPDECWLSTEFAQADRVSQPTRVKFAPHRQSVLKLCNAGSRWLRVRGRYD